MTVLTVKECTRAEQDFKLIFDGSVTLYLSNKVKHDRRGETKEWIRFKISRMLKALEDANINAVTKCVFYTQVSSVPLASRAVFLAQSFSKYLKWKEDKDQYFLSPPISPHLDVDDKLSQSKSLIKVKILFLKPKQSCEKTKMLLNFHLESVSGIPSLKREAFYLCSAWN